MKRFYQTRLFKFAGLGLGVLMWLANAGDPPNGRTGAPFDGHCGDCHSGGNFNGTVEINGLPSTIEPNMTYPLTITLTPTSGSPSTGGFQAVFVDNNNNCGDLTAGNAQSGTVFSGGREYIEQRGDKTFTGGAASWTFNWKSPVTVAGNTVKVYYIGNFTNNNNNDSGDFATSFSTSYAFSGAPPVTASISDIVNVSCNGGNNGSLTVTPDGGVPPYTYLWSNSQTTQTAVNLVAGNYTVTVTGSSGSGTATATAMVTQPPALTLSASSSNTITCAQPNATLTATGGGGTPAYSYNWFNGDTDNQTVVSAPGAYSVTLTDQNGCTKTTTVNVSGNITAPTSTAGPDATLTCQQNTATLNGTGSSSGPNFSYQWSTTNGNIVSGANTLTPVVNAAGTYTLVVTNNNNGCTSSDEAVVTANQTAPSATATGGQLTCSATSVQIFVTTNAGQPSFLWTGPNGFTSALQNPTVSVAGTYQVVVTNGSNGCSATASASVSQNTTPPTVTASASAALTCASTLVTLTGASNAGNYSWTGPGGFSSSQQNPTAGAPGVYTLSSTGSNGCVSSDTALVVQNTTPPGATASVSGQLNCNSSSVQLSGTTSGSSPSFLWTGPNNFTSNQQNPTVNAPGDYNLVVTSGQNGCSSSALVNVVQNIIPPVASATTPVSLTCTSSTVQLDGTASSQGPNYTAQWTTANGIIVSGATTLTPVVGAPGTYQLMVTNSGNGCISTTTVTVTQNPPVAATATVTGNVSCNGGADGAVAVAASGGNGAYTYLWSTGATTTSVSGLSAGTYSVTTTDGESCSAVSMATVTQPAVLTANAAATGETSAGANDGTATAQPVGGTSPYAFLWSNSATTGTITGLMPGSYTVSVSDAQGCSTVQTVTVNSFNCSLSASISAQNSTCNGANNGSASVNLSGAAAPVNYLWSNGATTQTASDLAPGNYTVQITDANNCPAALSVSITEPPVLLANAVASGETAAGANDGSATAQPTGGTSPYNYLWSTSATTASISGLAPGIYTVSVSDANNCSSVQSVNVNAFNCALSANISSANVACNGQSNGQATVTITGGVLPYDYLWSNGNTTATADQLAAGSYSVTVTDDNNCVVIGSVSITEPLVLAVSIVSVTNVQCPEDQNGAIAIDITGGTLPYQLQWSSGQGGQNLPPGTYTVSVTDNNGCPATQTATVVSTDVTPPEITCPAGPVYGCENDPVSYPQPQVSDNCNLNGAQAQLESGLASGSVFGLGTTTVVYSVKDASGNTNSCSFNVVVDQLPVISTQVSPETNSQGNGSILVAVQAGDVVSVSWTKDGVFYSGEQNLLNLSEGTYQLTMTTLFGCSVTFPPIVVSNSVGIVDHSAENAGIRIVPNPASSSFRLQSSGAEPVRVLLFDMRGNQVAQFAGEEASGELMIYMLPSGVYYVVAVLDNGLQRAMKLIKTD
ncbi:MAG: choice-of-anchor V domain-containing protein [Saprospiraceae bacterium]